MTVDDLRSTLRDAAPPAGLPALLNALWFAGHGDWSGAHAIAQDVDNSDGAWVHAHLHRVEGDADNAAYWYRRASKPVCTLSYDDEWADIARALLSTERIVAPGP
ncbi:MAG: hypothetical protein ABSC94_18220 [Polyangiaceae bacterium]|jgi:hypothetical protein